MKSNKHLSFWFFTASVMVVLVLSRLIQDGMFMDGLLYACISKNLATGAGTFWHPHFSKITLSFYDQNPPLGFGIQSLFFKLLGNSIYTERTYSFFCAIVHAFLIVTLWKQIFKNESELKKLGWLPILLWIIIPVCFWSYSNNMLENTMSIFDLLAIIFITRFMLHQQRVWYIVLAGLFTFLATLTKGIQGAFPLVVLAIGWVVDKRISFRKMMVFSLLLLSIPSAIFQQCHRN